jgi:ribosomal protein S18 acetylase RimI-like enzyme
VIRAARPADAGPLRALDRATWSPSVTPGSLSDAPFDTEGVIVAEVEGEVAGYVALGHPTGLASNRHVLSVRGLAVAPGFQGRGLGRALLRGAVAEARRRGARRLTLRVLGSNSAARALYESSGFTVEGVQRGEFLLDGDYVDDVLMALSLDRADSEALNDIPG